MQCGFFVAYQRSNVNMNVVGGEKVAAIVALLSHYYRSILFKASSTKAITSGYLCGDL
jgi:hypothetical protein